MQEYRRPDNAIVDISPEAIAHTMENDYQARQLFLKNHPELCKKKKQVDDDEILYYEEITIPFDSISDEDMERLISAYKKSKRRQVKLAPLKRYPVE